MKHPYYPSLDGVRAVAILIVLAAHAGLPLPRSGGVGVDVFFVLSGFLITSILVAERRGTGGIRLLNFYARRSLRLVPCLVLTCGLVAALSLVKNGTVPWGRIGVTLVYLSNWAWGVYGYELASLSPTWSLAVEEQYYLFWPLAILALERWSRHDLRNAGVLLAASLGLAAYRYGMSEFYTPKRIYVGLDTHADGLVLGGALAYLATAVRTRGGLSERSSKALGRVAVPLAAGYFAWLMVAVEWLDPWMARAGYFLTAAATAVILLDLLVGRHSWLRGWLEVRPAVYLGRISYGLYLLHLPIYFALDALPPVGLAVLFPVKLVTSVVAAALSYHFVETPALRLKQYFAVAPAIRRASPEDASSTSEPVGPATRRAA